MKHQGVTVFEPIKCVFQHLQACEHYFTVLQMYSSAWKFDPWALSHCHKVSLAFIVSGAAPEIAA